jgi:hypothetical protein
MVWTASELLAAEGEDWSFRAGYDMVYGRDREMGGGAWDPSGLLDLELIRMKDMWTSYSLTALVDMIGKQWRAIVMVVSSDGKYLDKYDSDHRG